MNLHSDEHPSIAYPDVSAALDARLRHRADHAPIRGNDTHSFSSMAASGEDFIGL